jgi:hypothetical protein
LRSSHPGIGVVVISQCTDPSYVRALLEPAGGSSTPPAGCTPPGAEHAATSWDAIAVCRPSGCVERGEAPAGDRAGRALEVRVAM